MRSIFRPWAGLWLICACAGARVGTRPDSKVGEDPLSHIELTVHHLSRLEAERLTDALSRLSGVRHVALTRSVVEGGGQPVATTDARVYVATYDLEFSGCECELPARIAAIPTPGLRYEGRGTRIQYGAYDNQPPQLSWIFPTEGTLFSESSAMVALELPDPDVVDAWVNDVPAERYRGNVFRARVGLKEGSNEVVATARDKAGNVGRSRVRVQVDSSPQAQEALLKIVVEGMVEPGAAVLIEGREVPVDAAGHYKAEVPVRRGQRQIEVVALDAQGGKTVTVKQIGL